ncbi:hypothetical protein BDD21_4283 [Thiocapsa rosea]|uniref:Uncharacterized protein n=1 Tax=Thiocapsa rosea TaxID=69360 RepID=A0A495VD96_9GAMM|nr:hypothetical protein BDD21_4283 [Thiocapsa rosea]
MTPCSRRTGTVARPFEIVVVVVVVVGSIIDYDNDNDNERSRQVLHPKPASGEIRARAASEARQTPNRAKVQYAEVFPKPDSAVPNRSILDAVSIPNKQVLNRVRSDAPGIAEIRSRAMPAQSAHDAVQQETS